MAPDYLPGNALSPADDAARLAALPLSLRRMAKITTLGPTRAPALLAHPDWTTPTATVMWFHGRTVSKELDPGRYSRLLKAGLAVCAIDLPGHGQRDDGRGADPAFSLAIIAEAVAEIDGIVAELTSIGGGVFDGSSLAIGGMSLGGMVALRRLCDEHPFTRALAESTTGALAELYSGRSGAAWPVSHDPAKVAAVDPSAHLESFRPIPLLVLHSEADAVVPWASQAVFVERLRAHYAAVGADAAMIEVKTWPKTGAPAEHAGFGVMSNEAKTLATAFLARGIGG
jgi:alpha-beta hydrolase superfamily lysophospholipase